MAVPYEFPFVQSEIGPRLRIVGDEQETRENSFKAVNDACVKIRAQKDDHWGLLIKTGGANAFGYAADVWLYNLGNGTAQVVDVVGNSEGAPPPEGGPRGMPVPAWGEKDIRGMHEWAEPLPLYEPDDGGGDSGGGTEPDNSELTARVTALEERATAQDAQIAQLTSTVNGLQQQLAQPLHAHGPVNLPLVFQDITHLRAKGDIDVEVKIGTATPPPPSDDHGPINPAALFAWIRRRRDDEEEGGQ